MSNSTRASISSHNPNPYPNPIQKPNPNYKSKPNPNPNTNPNPNPNRSLTTYGRIAQERSNCLRVPDLPAFIPDATFCSTKYNFSTNTNQSTMRRVAMFIVSL